MAVKDFMTTKVVYVSPETTVAKTADIMKEQGLRRLPVIDHDKLVGMVTEKTIAEASPSKATSLSIYEMNYLLNKTKVKDVMITDLVTIDPYASLEDAIYLMMKHKIGVLPVSDGAYLSGIITDRDIFRTFLEVSGYGEAGIRVRVLVDDAVGIMEKVVKVISDEGLNIRRTVQATRKSGKVVIEIQIDGAYDLDKLTQLISDQGVTVDKIERTAAKVL